MAAKAQRMAIFSSCDDQSKDLEPIVFNVPATYNNKVKVHNWQMHTLAGTRDNVDMFPPKGNLHISSYRRLGTDEVCTGTTETQAMLSQINLKDEYSPIYPQRSLFNIRSFLSTAKQEEQEDPKVSDVLLDPEQIRRMDYRTTKEIDYRPFYPMKPKPPPPPPPPEPWLLNRRTIGYSFHDLERRDCIQTFADDNMELHHEIAELKSSRNKLQKITDGDKSSLNFDDASKAVEISRICH